MRIRRGLSSRHLPCGCVVGIYETYSDETVAIIDVRGNACGDPAHTSGNAVPMLTVSRIRSATPDGTVR